MTCIQHYSIIQTVFTSLQILYALPNHLSSSTCQQLTTIDFLTFSSVLPFTGCHIVRIIQYLPFSDWLLSLINMHWKFLHIFLWLNSSFLFSAEQYPTVWRCHFILSPTEGHLGCFQFLAIMNKTAINIHVQVFAWTYIFNCFV